MTPGVLETKHFIPYIFMEWKVISVERESLCPNINELRHLLESKGYSPRDPYTLGQIQDSCFEANSSVPDIIWSHKRAIPLWTKNATDKTIECFPSKIKNFVVTISD